MKAIVLLLVFGQILTFVNVASSKDTKVEPAVNEAVDAKSVVSPYGFKFVSEDMEVEMATFTEKNADGLNDVLLKITGPAAYEEGIDQKVIRYTAVPAGTGVDFTYKKDGADFTRMLSRQQWGSWSFFELYLNNKTFKVYKNAEKSKEVKPLHLLTAYKQTPATSKKK